MNGEKVIGSMEKERNGMNNLTNNNFELWNQDYSTSIKK